MLVFVYGSLKEGFHNHRLLGNSKKIGEGRVIGSMYSMGAFPGLLDNRENFAIGEVYDVNEQTLSVLDHLEGYRESDKEHSFYIRKVVDCVLTTGRVIKVSVYFHNGFLYGDVIEDGVWSEKHYKKFF